MLLTRMNFPASIWSPTVCRNQRGRGTLKDRDGLIRRIAPDSLSPATQAALAQSDGNQAIALLLAAPEFQRR
jgi:hypothetical protein